MYDIMSAILNLLWLLMKTIGVYILLIFLIIMIIKIIIEYKKYGKRIFQTFKKKDIPKAYDDILYISLNKIKGYKKIIKPTKLKSDYILIYSNGIVLFKLFSEQGHFINKDNYLYYGDQRIMSPFIFDEDIKIIRNIVDVPIKGYAVTNEKTYIDGVDQICINKIIYTLKNDGDIKNIDEIEKLLSKSV